MLHACFVYDPTCFMCIFKQYLAFSGTNLLTRCHSACSCFLLFLVASGPTRAPPTPHLRLFNIRFGKTLETREKIHEKFRSRRHQQTHLGRVLELFLAPCRRDKSPPEAFFIAMPASAMMCE